MESVKKRFRERACAAALLAVLLTALLTALLCACDYAGQEKIEDDLSVISRRLTEAGYDVSSHDPGSELLSALEDEMNETLREPAEKALKGYLFARDAETGELALELFVFEDARDAKKLYDHLKDNDSFVNGLSEIRLDGKVVYMGLLPALDRAEKNADAAVDASGW